MPWRRGCLESMTLGHHGLYPKSRWGATKLTIAAEKYIGGKTQIQKKEHQ